jgi:spore germination protein GerM
MFVPVQRRVPVQNDRVAQAAVEALIDGPRNGLQRLVLPDARLLGIQIANGTATVNFDRRPAGAGDNRGLLSIMYTLIEFPSITRVQIQVNGRNIGLDGDGPIAWRPINVLNPAGLPQDFGQTAFLPLYFVADDGRHDIRIIRMVPKTTEVARATVNALIEGPLDYGDRVWSPIPADTELRGIKKDGSTIIVDFTQPFADAPDHDIAVRTVVESLTTLPGVNGVLFLVEGNSLAEQWGQRYGRTFPRPAINPE